MTNVLNCYFRTSLILLFFISTCIIFTGFTNPPSDDGFENYLLNQTALTLNHKQSYQVYTWNILYYLKGRNKNNSVLDGIDRAVELAILKESVKRALSAMNTINEQRKEENERYVTEQVDVLLQTLGLTLSEKNRKALIADILAGNTKKPQEYLEKQYYLQKGRMADNKAMSDTFDKLQNKAQQLQQEADNNKQDFERLVQFATKHGCNDCAQIAIESAYGKK